MEKRGRLMSRKGQFFIIAAVIISSILVGLVVTKNYITPGKEEVKFYDISAEIKQESSRAIDYGVVKNVDALPNFTQAIATHVNDIDPNAQFIFIYGNRSSIVVENYGNISVEVNGKTVAAGGAAIKNKVCYDNLDSNFCGTWTQQKRSYTGEYIYRFRPQGNELIVSVGENEYPFTLVEGEQFYLILTKTSGGETNVVAG